MDNSVFVSVVVAELDNVIIRVSPDRDSALSELVDYYEFMTGDVVSKDGVLDAFVHQQDMLAVVQEVELDKHLRCERLLEAQPDGGV